MGVPIVGLIIEGKARVDWMVEGSDRGADSSKRTVVGIGIIKATVDDDGITELGRVKDAKLEGSAAAKNYVGVMESVKVLSND
jgi:hypothetical protein